MGTQSEESRMTGTELPTELLVAHGYGYVCFFERYKISDDPEKGSGLLAESSFHGTATRFIPVDGGPEAACRLLEELNRRALSARRAGMDNPYIDAEGAIKPLRSVASLKEAYAVQPQHSSPRM
jgi:hypothetical protein